MQRAHMAIDIAYSVQKTAGFQRFFAIRPCKIYKIPYENGLHDDGVMITIIAQPVSRLVSHTL